MNHCAGRDRSYARRVMSGRLYFYRMIESERLTIAIRSSRQGWIVEEIRGQRNRRPREPSKALILSWLRSSSAASVEATLADPAFPPFAGTVSLPPRGRRRPVSADQLSFAFVPDNTPSCGMQVPSAVREDAMSQT
jgi:hypothetical protein